MPVSRAPASQPTSALSPPESRPRPHVAAGVFLGWAGTHSAGRSQWSQDRDEGKDLRDHDDDGRQPEGDSGVGPDVDRRAVVDVAQAQRPQRDDPRRPGSASLRRR